MQQEYNEFLQENLTPYQIIAEVRKAHHKLMELCSSILPDKIEEPCVIKKDTFQDILYKIDLQDEEDVQKTVKQRYNKMKYEAKIEFIKNNQDLMTSNFYIQELLEESQTKVLKNEAINVALFHMEQGFPSMQRHNMDYCSLTSYQLMKDNITKPARHHPNNILRPFICRFDMKQNNIDQDEVVIHASIYHPFTRKKTQEIILLGCQKLKDIPRLIQCSVEKTEQKYFKDELESFEPHSFDFCSDLETQLGDTPIQLCKIQHYTHLNQCVHWIVFHEVRELCQSDVKDIQQYEKGVNCFESAPLIKNCEGCGLAADCYRMLDPKISSEAPSFYCNSCDRILHYDGNGNPKLDSEKAIPYLQH